jgi:hypothetical protein
MRMGGVSAPFANYSLKDVRDAQLMEYLYQGRKVRMHIINR